MTFSTRLCAQLVICAAIDAKSPRLTFKQVIELMEALEDAMSRPVADVVRSIGPMGFVTRMTRARWHLHPSGPDVWYCICALLKQRTDAVVTTLAFEPPLAHELPAAWHHAVRQRPAAYSVARIFFIHHQPSG